jgi:hypothetical protein
LCIIIRKKKSQKQNEDRMTLKEAIQGSKTTRKSKRLYEVHVDFQLIETRFLTEIVQADSDEDAIEKAKLQFSMRPKNYIGYCSNADIKNDDRFSFENIRPQIKKRNKNKSITRAQRRLLEQLCISNRYVRQRAWYNGAIEWRLVQSLRAKGEGYRDGSVHIPIVTIRGLFRRGLLIPIVVRDKLEDEMKIQKALGTAGDIYMFYGINFDQVKSLGIELKNMHSQPVKI